MNLSEKRVKICQEQKNKIVRILYPNKKDTTMADKKIQISFGKYKGLPKEIILNDPVYAEWILGQPSLWKSNRSFMIWLKEKFESGAIVVNPLINKHDKIFNPRLDQPTPQHNSAQNLFTSRDFARRFLRLLVNYDIDQGLTYWLDQIKHVMKDYNQAFVINEDKTQITIGKSFVVRICDWFNHLRMEGNLQEHDVCIDSPRINQNGFVRICLGWSIMTEGVYPEGFTLNKYFNNIGQYRIICPPIYIEIKPLMGDDYPRVLAKMQKKGQNVLYIQTYQSNTTPLNITREIFSRAGIRIITQEELVNNVTKRIEPITPPPSVRDGTRITVIDKVTKVDMLGVPMHLFNAFKHFVDINGVSVNYNLCSASPLPNHKDTRMEISPSRTMLANMLSIDRDSRTNTVPYIDLDPPVKSDENDPSINNGLSHHGSYPITPSRGSRTSMSHETIVKTSINTSPYNTRRSAPLISMKEPNCVECSNGCSNDSVNLPQQPPPQNTYHSMEVIRSIPSNGCSDNLCQDGTYKRMVIPNISYQNSSKTNQQESCSSSTVKHWEEVTDTGARIGVSEERTEHYSTDGSITHNLVIRRKPIKRRTKPQPILTVICPNILHENQHSTNSCPTNNLFQNESGGNPYIRSHSFDNPSGINYGPINMEQSGFFKSVGSVINFYTNDRGEVSHDSVVNNVDSNNGNVVSYLDPITPRNPGYIGESSGNDIPTPRIDPPISTNISIEKELQSNCPNPEDHKDIIDPSSLTQSSDVVCEELLGEDLLLLF